MNPKRFLTIGGCVLIAVGTLGVVGLFQRISSLGFFHPPYWINWVHIGIGIFALVVSRNGNPKLQARVTLIPAVLGLLLGISGLLLGRLIAQQYAIPELADPSDHIAHLIVGIAAWWGWSKKR